ncbi:hypothetical protein CSC18_2838 [Klebsiella aerogenes]|nr:hypothetical protein CSC18_2838 [Klebsiella aerogenes]
MIIAFKQRNCLRHFSLPARFVRYKNITNTDMLKKQPLEQQNR